MSAVEAGLTAPKGAGSRAALWTLASLALMGAFAAILLAMGRDPICPCGTVEFWHAAANDSGTSQHISDWYSLSHVIHGFLFYGAAHLIGRVRGKPLGFGLALLLAIAITSQLMGPSLQLFLLDASPDAPSLAAALHHSALNIGNSLGAALGAAVLAAGWGLLAPAWAGVVLAVLGLGIAGWSLAVHRRQVRRSATTAPVAPHTSVPC